ncbi:Gfo/Idh/MocA family oxidoreductase [Bradyrhizobium sp.]|jgi:predicted dehydrogenase|uniref:Gfo/Idh/MocA family protein n=1 Tax=Bradyrhizobium sp. TaxID=376 RepID=UPI002CBFC6C6|nr:Gfo/Idh/MocA family oxidoreductase [Bradyrhizobium sp.]HWX63758.1 Gfo/Idh/MocA family oxidoreductase [Bradyrhizobium sp.]
MLTAVLVGCGRMSRAWLDAVRNLEGLRLVGLVDIDVIQAEGRARDYGLSDAAVGADLAAILAATKPDIVFDVAVPQARRQVVETAFAHGCHVLTEKPMAIDRDDARAILLAANRSGRLHGVVQNRRYLAAVRRIRRFLDSGALGRPTSLHCDFFLAPHFGGFREAIDHVLLIDMAIHTFDVARYIIDGTPKSVFCAEWEPVNSWYKSGSSAAAIFRMEGGAIFNYRGSWCAAGLKTSWESSWRIVCERGALTWDGFDGLVAERITDRRDGLLDLTEMIEVPALDPRDRIGGHLGIIEEFVDAVRTGREPETRGADNIKSLAMVFAAIESAGSGCQVAVEI